MSDRMVFLDYDISVRADRFPDTLFKVKRHWIDWKPSEFLELILMDVRRLQTMFKLGRALVYRSSDKGFHVIFPDARLTLEQALAVALTSLCSRRYVEYSMIAGDQTLRVSRKRNADKPQLISLVEPP
jgi:hypothetical protein